jgi:hypothetical protein
VPIFWVEIEESASVRASVMFRPRRVISCFDFGVVGGILVSDL